MGSYTGIFKRTEKKYCLCAAQRRIICEAVRAQMMPDAYGRHRVNSLYLDTAERSLIARSLEKPLYKEKLRLRWYGPAAPDAPAFIEMKKKFKGVVYKRRVAMSARGAVAYLEGAPFDEAVARYPLLLEGRAVPSSALDNQIAREIDALRSRHDALGPSALISCSREAWVSPEACAASDDDADDLRITFDDDLAFADLMNLDAPTALHSATGQHTQPMRALVSDSILEVKSTAPYPRWLIDALNRAHAYPQSFSKYGTMSMLSAAPSTRTRANVRSRVHPLAQPRRSDLSPPHQARSHPRLS
ncbi:polyphosphate polymerase domain-containing protein [Adlercreutzia murintestinalis]|uniref:polyphosphate polymerase domain-containing protein n=1 Tax=Adlercreutzia murintestinalis TaxID=2941325 RepID=UPI00203A833D|nr:polyphosphate polymerase domain-containing protein [Adlercreutzia murintestinalis]